MKVRNPFKRMKDEEDAKKIEETDLEKICGEDKETYQALQHTMFVDPRKIGETLKDAAKKAEYFEKRGDSLQAGIWYHVAGGLALWEGDVMKIKQYFSKSAKLNPEADFELITKIPKKAIEKAQKYYSEFLK